MLTQIKGLHQSRDVVHRLERFHCADNDTRIIECGGNVKSPELIQVDAERNNPGLAPAEALRVSSQGLARRVDAIGTLKGHAQ